MNSQQDPSPNTTKVDVFTNGELLEDGTLLELVRLSVFSWEVGLLRSNRASFAIGPRLEIAGTVYRPAEIAQSVGRAINLPTAPREYASTQDLFNRTVAFLRRYTGLTSEDSRLAAFFVFASWFPEVVPRRLTLLVLSAFPAEVVSLLRTLRLLCRNSLLLGDLNAPGFCALPLSLTPTVIMDQTRISARLMGLLHVANVPDLVVNDGGHLISPACFQVLCPGHEDIDPILTRDMLQISLAPRQRDAETLDELGTKEALDEIQPRLLAYRLQNFSRVSASSFDAPEFGAPFRHIARTLGAAIVDDEVLQGELISLLRPQADEVRAQEMATPEYAITLAVLSLLHSREKKGVPVYLLTAAVNAALQSFGERVEYSPPQIGYRILGLGLRTIRTSAGKVLRLDRETSRKIHDLAVRLGVPLPDGGFPGCPDCGRSSEPNVNKALM